MCVVYAVTRTRRRVGHQEQQTATSSNPTARKTVIESSVRGCIKTFETKWIQRVRLSRGRIRLTPKKIYTYTIKHMISSIRYFFFSVFRKFSIVYAVLFVILFSCCKTKTKTVDTHARNTIRTVSFIVLSSAIMKIEVIIEIGQTDFSNDIGRCNIRCGRLRNTHKYTHSDRIFCTYVLRNIYARLYTLRAREDTYRKYVS